MIQGDILTKERMGHGDIAIQEGERGGVQLRALCYLDVLLDADVITISQHLAGQKYMSLAEMAFNFLGHAKNRLYADVQTDCTESEASGIDSAEEGAAAQIYMGANKRLDAFDRTLISDCMLPIGAHKMAILAAYKDHSIARAFSNLEDAITEATTDFIQKCKI